MELNTFVTRLTPEERATYDALVEEAEGPEPDGDAIRRRLARLIGEVRARLDVRLKRGPLIVAFREEHLPAPTPPTVVPLPELVRRLPYPLARKLAALLVSRERRAEGEGVPLLPYELCATMGILVRMAAVIGLQAYVRIAGAGDTEVNRRVVEALRMPTDGKWRDLALLLADEAAKRDDAPLARKTRDALGRKEVPVPKVPTVAVALQELVHYRNRLFHGRRVTEEETDRALTLLLAAVEAFAFLADYDLLVHHEGSTYRLSGADPHETDGGSVHLPANAEEDEPYLVLREGGEPALSLAPLLVFYKGKGTEGAVIDFDELFFLNAGAAERLSYIAYRYAQHLSGHDLGTYEAFRRFMRLVPAPYIPPNPRIDYGALAEEHGRLFVGRKDVLDAIEAFVAERPAPYGVVKALGGMGKTAVFASLYRDHHTKTGEPPEGGDRWAFHFCASQGSRDNTVVALRSLIAQICGGFGLERRSRLSNDLEVLQANFAALLNEAGQHLAEGERLVLAVDALDEGISESPRDRIPAILPARVPDHVVVLVSYRVDETNQNTRVETSLGHVPAADCHALDLADPLVGLTRANVATYLERLADGSPVPERTLEAVMTAADYGGEGADPFYLRFVADGVEAGRIDLARPETVPASLDEAFDDLWMRLPTGRDFLVHRILGLLAVMRDDGDDDLFAYLLGPEQPEGAEPLTSLEVASLRAQAGKLLVYDSTTTGDRYGLFHDRFRAYLIGEPSDEEEDLSLLTETA